MSSAEPGGATASPVECGICNHNGRYTQCPGCGGLIGMGKWPPCTFCQAVIGVVDPQPPGPMPMMSTIHGQIEATEPRTLPDERQRRQERYHDLARAIATWEGEVTPLPPLEAFAAEAATNVPSDLEPDEVLAYEIQCLQHNVLSLEEKIGELSKSIAALTQAVLGRNA